MVLSLLHAAVLVLRMVRVRIFALQVLVCLLALPPRVASAQTQTPAQKPAPPKLPAQQATPQPIPSPVSKHYPILIVAHGNEPFWSLRLGMKGPERLDRLGYPPVVLDPAEIVADQPGVSWTYNAKDTATGALVSVKLTRDSCSDNMSDMKYTFKIEVHHAQIGTLSGCGQSAPDKFPEFRKKNQLDMPDDVDAKDKDKKTVLDPITKFDPPVAVAYLDSAGRLIVVRGAIHKTAALTGSEPALSHDGKKLLFTYSASRTAQERSILLYDFDTGRTNEVASSNARQAFWSPDDSHMAYLKFDGKNWQVWTAPTNEPEKATLLSPQTVLALHGWSNATTVLATDAENAYWISEDKPAETVPLQDIYGSDFRIMNSDTLRACPINSDLLLVSAYYVKAPAGAPTDATGLNETFFLYEVRSKRRTILGPADAFARNAEWSRDALQIFFTKGVPSKGVAASDRIFWDGTGDKRYSSGVNLVVGK